MRMHSFAVVVAAVVGLFAAEALACRCRAPVPGREGARERFDASAAVFRGKVLRVEPLDEATASRRLRLTFEVSESWKGVRSRQVDVATAGDTAACGVYAEVGTEFLVFAQPTEDGDLTRVRYSAHSCNGTSPISQIEDGQPEWLAFLAEQPTLALTPSPDASSVDGESAGTTSSSEPEAMSGSAPEQQAPAARAEEPQRAGGCASCSSTGLGLGMLPLLALGRLLGRRRAARR